MSADLKKLSEELVSCSSQISAGISDAAWHDWLENVAAPAVSEAADALASKDEEIRRLREAWDWLSSRRDLELSHEYDWPEEGDPGAWQVHRVSGGRNDREWELVGFGLTALFAVNHAMLTLQGDADVSR